MRRPRIVGAPMILFGIVCVGAMGLVTLGLWNALMPAIFSLPAISFWQALGLLLLGRLLFGRLGPGMGRPRFARGWKGLTDEERQRFRNAMEGRGAGRSSSGEQNIV